MENCLPESRQKRRPCIETSLCLLFGDGVTRKPAYTIVTVATPEVTDGAVALPMTQ